MLPQWPSEPHVSYSILSQALQGQRGHCQTKEMMRSMIKNIFKKYLHNGGTSNQSRVCGEW